MGDTGLTPGLERYPQGGHDNSGTLAWRILWAVGPGGLPSTELDMTEGTKEQHRGDQACIGPEETS